MAGGKSRVVKRYRMKSAWLTFLFVTNYVIYELKYLLISRCQDENAESMQLYSQFKKIVLWNTDYEIMHLFSALQQPSIQLDIS